MTFKEQTSLDMENVFLNTDEFAEDIVYTPKCGAAVTIPAIVDRVPVNPQAEDQGRIIQKRIEITIHKDADNGVTTVDTKGDKCTFAVILGEDPVDWDVLSIVEAGEAHWRLLVGR